ncbi:PREDICTED: lipase member M-like [Thamnophis sirtalis]|uniref:Lipase member M-like n=1 Tax=Thamnophis sirtalis TaxID=35019 RepID=A0A6I9Y8B0_9SAUR|nr:PREDICTED: lipase member M-like [Thamnophis sirtalis]
MNISEIIQYWRYPSEEYDILTSDGYYLKANRIPHGIHSPEKTESKPVVLLVSGILTEGRSWLINLPTHSLGFVLADAGYDVWIINNRGTTWCRRHQTLTVDQEEFWDFSFHEMAIYDIPAAMNFILNKTKQDSLYYIGHSQGASMGVRTRTWKRNDGLRKLLKTNLKENASDVFSFTFHTTNVSKLKVFICTGLSFPTFNFVFDHGSFSPKLLEIKIAREISLSHESCSSFLLIFCLFGEYIPKSIYLRKVLTNV